MSETIQQKRQRLKAFRDQLKAGRPQLGCFSALPSPGFVEALGHSTLDFIIIDTEHGPASIETAETLLRAADAAGTNSFVRVPANRPDMISAMLDCGAAGVMVPMVETVEQLDIVRDAMRFAPTGRRGVAPNTRAGAYGFLPMADFMAWGNEDTVMIGQIETVRAVENVEALLAHGVFDVAFIGTNDLSTSMGLPGQVSHPDVMKAVDKVVATAAKHDIPVGSVAVSIEMANDWVQRGVNMVTLSSMIGFRAYDQQAAEVRKTAAPAP